jgi:hypothetical protein
MNVARQLWEPLGVLFWGLPKQGRKPPVLNQTLIDELDMPLEEQSNRLSTTQTGGQNHAGSEENDLEARPVHCALNLILFF